MDTEEGIIIPHAQSIVRATSKVFLFSFPFHDGYFMYVCIICENVWQVVEMSIFY